MTLRRAQVFSQLTQRSIGRTLLKKEYSLFVAVITSRLIAFLQLLPKRNKQTELLHLSE